MKKSTKVKKSSTRARQVAKLRSSKALLGVLYFLTGQTDASSAVNDYLPNHMARGVVRQTKRPLAMNFVRPSGSEETELDR